MFSHNYNGRRWGFAFFQGDSRLGVEGLDEIVLHAVNMHLKDEKRSEIKNNNYEGVVYTNNNYELLGSFGGKRFDAELDTNKGKVKLRFLITEYMEGVFN